MTSIWLKAAEKVVRTFSLPPTSVSFEVSKLCNLHCIACRRWYYDSTREGYVSIDKYRQAIDNIGWVKDVNVIGPDGEPLCNPDFNRIIEYNTSKYINTTFTTNGMLVTPELVNHWKSNKVSQIGISLDSPNKEEYEMLRPGANFDKVISSCRLINSAGIELHLNMIVFESNVDKVLDFAKLAKDVGASKVYYIRPQYTGSYNKNLNPIITLKRIALFEGVKEFLIKNKIGWYEPLCLGTYFRPCMFPFTSPWITLEGNIKPCCFIFGNHTEYLEEVSYEINGDKYILGNVYKDNFEKVWTGPKFREVREFIKSTEYLRGSQMSLEELKEWKLYPQVGNRFEQCRSCTLRWGLEG